MILTNRIWLMKRGTGRSARCRGALSALLALPALAHGPAFAAGDATPNRSDGIERSNVVWESPSANSRGSMPIGNGDLGANVWVEPSGDLVLLLSKTDAWDENQRLVKLGRVRIKLEPVLDTTTGFRQELKLRDGMILVRTPRAELRVWIDANHPVVQVDGKSADGKPLVVTAALEVWRTAKVPCDPGYPNFVEPKPFSWPDTVMKTAGKDITWFHCNAVSPWRNNLGIQKLDAITNTTRDPILGRTFGAVMRGDGFIAASDRQLKTARPVAGFSLRIHALTQPNSTPEQWHVALGQQVSAVEALPGAERLAAHRQWWSAFWQRSWINLDGDTRAEAVTRAYTLQRWMSACSGRGAYPIKFNGSIFNVDTNEKKGQGSSGDADYRRWGGCYWYQNTRLSYWPMLAAGDFDCMLPFFKLYTDNLPVRRLAAKTYYNHGGAFFPETMTIWGTCNDVNYGPNRTGKPDGLTVNSYIRRYWQNGLEMTAMMLDYYDLTQDARFRDETLLPYAAEILAFFDQHWPRGADGTILFNPAQSLETWWNCTNPMPEIAGLRYVIPRLLKLTGDAKLTVVWRKTLADLPPVPMTAAEPKRLLPAEKFSNKHNMENPELYAVFPFRLYTQAAGKNACEIGKTTYAKRGHRDNYCWRQDPIQAALLGLADPAGKSVYGRTRGLQPGFRFPAMWAANSDWMPDQDHGGVMQSALQYMVLQYEGDRILVLPAWPKDWNVSFKLHAPKNTTVECELRGGKVVKLVVTPEARRKDVEIGQSFTTGATSGLIPYNFPAEQPRSASCAATVDGLDVPVFGSQVGSFLNFGLSGPVEVRLTFNKAPKHVVIRPLNEKITPTLTGNTCAFTVPRAMTLSVELDGDLKQPVFLFANPPLENPCKKEDPKVRYFAAGKIHEAGEIVLKDGETLFLEPGAVLHAVVRAVNARNVAIRGAGIIDATPRKNKINLLAFRECTNVVQENVILLNSYGFNNHLSGSQDITVRRVRALGWRHNCDGIDIEYCRNVRVDGCFWRVSDDCVSIKAQYPPGITGVPFIEMINPEIYGRHKVKPIKDDTVGDIHVENSVFWNDLPGNAFDLGFDLRIDNIRKVTVRNCDIIHVLRGAAFAIHNGDRCKVDNVLLDNIRVEDTDELFDFYVGLSVYSDDCPKPYRRDNPKRIAPPGTWRDRAAGDNAGQWIVLPVAESKAFVENRGRISNITIRNLQVLTAPRSGSTMYGFDAEHGINNVTIEALTIQGKPVTSMQDARIRTRYAENIRFQSDLGDRNKSVNK